MLLVFCSVFMCNIHTLQVTYAEKNSVYIKKKKQIMKEVRDGEAKWSLSNPFSTNHKPKNFPYNISNATCFNTYGISRIDQSVATSSSIYHQSTGSCVHNSLFSTSKNNRSVDLLKNTGTNTCSLNKILVSALECY